MWVWSYYCTCILFHFNKYSFEVIYLLFKTYGGFNTDDVLVEWIKEIDSDGDEKVNFHEFLRYNAMLFKEEKKSGCAVSDPM